MHDQTLHFSYNLLGLTENYAASFIIKLILEKGLSFLFLEAKTIE